MANECTCENEITYIKAIPSEVINIGDVIMLDPSTGYIKRAVLEKPYEYSINTRLVVGICVWTDNKTPLQEIIDGGNSKINNREDIDGGSSDNIQTIIINGGSSKQNTREIIKVAYTGEQVVNLCGPVNIGDRLCISNRPGIAKSKDYLENTYEDIRSIGKVIRFVNGRTQAKVLLDIE